MLPEGAGGARAFCFVGSSTDPGLFWSLECNVHAIKNAYETVRGAFVYMKLSIKFENEHKGFGGKLFVKQPEFDRLETYHHL